MVEHLRENAETVLSCDACGSIKFKRRTEWYRVEIVQLLVEDGNITDDWIEDVDGDGTYSYRCAACDKEYKEEDLSREKLDKVVKGHAGPVV